MKKTIALFLILAISLSLLCGCNGIGDFYTVKVTGDISALITPIMPIYRAGSLVKIKAYPVTDISLHVFVNGDEISMSHFDSDYWGFEFIMPEENITIHLTYNQFYGRDEYAFNDLHPLNFMKNEITKVSVKTNSKNVCLVPFVKAIVLSVDIKTKRIQINNIEGLLS